MTKTIDCFFIGHNEMNFPDYEKNLRKMGTGSGSYRDLNLNFTWYNRTPCTPTDMFNLFFLPDNGDAGGTGFTPLRFGETFSPAVAYLGTYLDRRGFSFDYVNSFQEEKDELAKKLSEENILAVAITTTLYVSVFPILEIIRFIRRYNGSARIIVGGPFIFSRFRILNRVEFEYLLDSMGADFYINSSQGEAALVRLLQALKGGGPPELLSRLEGLKNIYFKGGDGYVFLPLEKEDNRLWENMVNWDIFKDRVGEYVIGRTAISCPYACTFCGYPEYAGQYQAVAVDAIENELNLLERIGTVTSVSFIDDTFNVPRERFKDILRMLIRNKYGFKWHSYFRCQFADRETLDLMKESGCEGVFLGLESGNNRVLANMNKGVTVEKYRAGLELLNEYEILTFGSFLMGFPGETEETARETAAFIEAGGLDFYRAHLWYCDDNAPIRRYREKYKIKNSNYEWSHATMDARKASEIINEMFFSIRRSVWVPQYNFSFEHLFHLLNRGMSLERVKDFLRAFNSGIQEKILDPSRKDIGLEKVKALKAACRGNDYLEEDTPKTAPYQADFDF